MRRLGAEGVALIVSAGTIGWMVLRAVAGRAALGDVALFYQAFQRGQGLVRALFGNVNQLHSNGLFLGNLFEYLDLKNQISAAPGTSVDPSRGSRTVRFERVSFRYPGSKRLALDNLDLTVEGGKIVAVVGSNGAGKSTLIKLLSRFYDPDEGRITIDGVDIRTIAPDSLHKGLGILFQTPLQYQGTVRENVVLSAPDLAPDSSRLESTIRDSGAQALVSRLPLGVDSPLGRYFPAGTELSGGEWQRVALARAFYRAAPIILLDEPTSHLDSWAESDWFERLRKLGRGASVLVITHRLSIASHADVIHVLEDGRVVESGSHTELLARSGRYASAWARENQV